MILDRGHSACLDPVDLVSVARFVEDFRRASLGLLRDSVAEQFLILILRPVGELIVAELETMLSSIVLIDELVESAEVGQAGVELLDRVNDLAEFDQVVHKLHRNGLRGGCGTKGGCGSEGFHLEILIKLL